jgi:hypothetical protein
MAQGVGPELKLQYQKKKKKDPCRRDSESWCSQEGNIIMSGKEGRLV